MVVLTGIAIFAGLQYLNCHYTMSVNLYISAYVHSPESSRVMVRTRLDRKHIVDEDKIDYRVEDKSNLDFYSLHNLYD